MKSPMVALQWLPILMLIPVMPSTSVTAKGLRIPRLARLGGMNNPRVKPLGRISRNSASFAASSIYHNLQTFYYNQTLDHFNYRPDSFDMFQQRYVINSKYWGGANSNAPIFVYFGEEAPLENDFGDIGILAENAHRFKALQVYIEHRYYGKSIPFGSRNEAFKNASTLGYFNSAQALADYAELIIHVKEKFHVQRSPVIVVGASYGGMLASWFRLKYPHIALGALASSAPILYFTDITPAHAYVSIVTKDFREDSQSCHDTIKKSWTVIDKIASEPDGLSILSKKFETCKPLNNSSELKDYLAGIYMASAQYDAPPSYPVTMVCKSVDEPSFGNDILGRIFAGMVAYQGELPCYVNEPTKETETDVGWSWQTCADMVIPFGISNDSMFQPYPFDLNAYINDCKDEYGVPPRPHWVTTYFGGHDIKLILKRFGSNIIFSNGLRDPYSSGGVLQNISDSVVAITTVKGSHCLDVLATTKSDPQWLVAQRKEEVRIIRKWIRNYFSDLDACEKGEHH
ncbi:hypothetical protein H0E87_030082 [Populus deltoides]|uniref:Lysosomal Pro-X carboxypeptidase n=1 Tax=Populus deltoides TaxID=3696 RepID=A0A8T2WNH2_POPDE|nr:hypothetical protein H0E87_030082 [Populus deltoides]